MNIIDWIEGAAIIGAVGLVTGVSSVVDWKKEGQFLANRAKSDEKNVVSIRSNFRLLEDSYMGRQDYLNERCCSCLKTEIQINCLTL